MISRNTLELGLLKSVLTRLVSLDGTTATEITTGSSKITYIPYAAEDFFYCWAEDASAAATKFGTTSPKEFARASAPAEFWHYQKGQNLYIKKATAGVTVDGLSYEQVD